MDSDVEAREAQFLTVQQCLHGIAGQVRRQLLEYLEHARHRDQFGAKFVGEHARAGITRTPAMARPRSAP